MNDEPKEAKGANPGETPSPRAREAAKQDGNVNQTGDQGASQGGTSRSEVQDLKTIAAAGDVINATNAPSATLPRRVMARANAQPPGANTPPASAGRSGQQKQEQKQEDSLRDVTIAGQMILNTITEYSQVMKPGRLITQAEGMRQQVSLCNAIFATINTLDADFKPVLTTILDILHRQRDAAFRETHLFRYWDNVPLSKNQRRGFEKIITLLKTLADPKTRQTALRQVDFERLLQYGLTEKGRTRFAAYFGK
jgi:hypothetical protein